MGEEMENSTEDVHLKITKMVLAALFAALMAVGAYISIPITPLSMVPITLQTFFIFLAPLVIGKKWGTISVFVYVLVGLIGFPVFSNGQGGFGVLFGPTGGYIFSFVFVAYMIGWMYEKSSKKPLPAFLIVFLGCLINLICGSVYMSFAAHMPMPLAFLSGFLPFVVGGAIKAAATVLAATAINKKLEQQRVNSNEGDL
ncbi:Biotin transporter BioY [Methanosarcinaceae archaeon Ag5]|uniref:Biotin transporter BioY n=1 Tax=Methanolapillus africanus TaxID=3028297 RepID=A0AAE4MI47_9EURY|nr:Biotin transporter BioY [Methanosarcinaceae archaeon Ag5]